MVAGEGRGMPTFSGDRFIERHRCRHLPAAGRTRYRIPWFMRAGTWKAQQRIADDLRSRGARSVVVQGDLADPATADALVSAAMHEFDGLDVLVANAGFADRTRLDELSLERFANSPAGDRDGIPRAASAPRIGRSPPGRRRASSRSAPSSRTASAPTAPFFLPPLRPREGSRPW
jgi:hypothetical protein